ncbi:MAG TPA: AAA family ATPase [Polyangiaceae bacterium]|nr:AAA family ATPase [Polyangiaceae bacterium]
MPQAIANFESRLNSAQEALTLLKKAIARVIVGQDAVVEEVLWCLIAGGHVLLEGNPGLGKTLLVRTLSACLDLRFSRIQFTPDLMPSDVIGTNVLVLASDGSSSGRFELHRGPIFGQVVLADEINRATPKTQSALLEAMQEHAVTIGGTRHALEEPFFVLATENPIEMEGTYPLPEAQLDRFLLKVVVPAPSQDELTTILERTTGQPQALPERVLDREQVLELCALCRDVAVAEPVLRYAARLVGASSPENATATPLVRRAVRYGAGVRGAQALILTAKAVALLEGRGHVAFGDLQRTAKPVLRHRILRSFEGEADGITPDQIVDELIKTVPTLPQAVEQAVQGR